MIFSEQSASTRLKPGPGFFRDHALGGEGPFGSAISIRQTISAMMLSACGGDLSRMQDAFPAQPTVKPCVNRGANDAFVDQADRADRLGCVGRERHAVRQPCAGLSDQV